MRTRLQIAASRRNLLRRLPTPAKGNGRVEKSCRMAFMALGDTISTSQAIEFAYPWDDCAVIITGVPRTGRDDGLEIPKSSSTPWSMVEMKPVEKLPPPRPQPM